MERESQAFTVAQYHPPFVSLFTYFELFQTGCLPDINCYQIFRAQERSQIIKKWHFYLRYLSVKKLVFLKTQCQIHHEHYCVSCAAVFGAEMVFRTMHLNRPATIAGTNRDKVLDFSDISLQTFKQVHNKMQSYKVRIFLQVTKCHISMR